MCAFHHNVAETAILWLNTSTAKIWLKKRQRVLKTTPTGSRTGFRSPTRRGRFTGAEGRGGSCVSSIGAGTVDSAGVASLGTRVLLRGRGWGGADAAREAVDDSLIAWPGGLVVRFFRGETTGGSPGL